MEPIAQTNVQLYNQLQRQRRSAEELELVRCAYDLAKGLYSGYFQADGAPFLAHVTGVASIVARLGLPGNYVAAACLHNVYTNGDFGDGRGKCVTAGRRRVVANAVSRGVEAHVHRFWLHRQKALPLHVLQEQVHTLTAEDRQLVIMDLADLLEKCHAMGPLYYGDGAWVVDHVRRDGPALAVLARHLGHPSLAAMLSDSITALLSAAVPQGLRCADPRRKYIRLEIPRSCMLKPGIVVRRRMRQLLRRLRRDAPAPSARHARA